MLENILEELQHIIDDRILPAQTMGFEISAYDGDTLTVSAPLSANTNHHGTVFGGSQYSIAAVAGWALLRCKLADAGLNGAIVVKTATMDYLRPVSSEHFAVTVQIADAEQLAASLERLDEHGSARFYVTGVIRQNDQEAARSSATYTIRKRPAQDTSPG